MTFARKSDVLRWTLTLITGILCGIVALLVTFFTKLLTTFKYGTFYRLIDKERENIIPFGSAFTFLLLCNIFFAFVAWTMVFLEPLAAGSGRCSAFHCL